MSLHKLAASTSPLSSLPTYNELLNQATPGAAWGIWGPGDEFGTLNLAHDPSLVRQAAQHVTAGKVFSLNWSLELPDPPLFGRSHIQHTIMPSSRSGGHNDQIDCLNPQASTQWDGLSHFPHQVYGFYGGVKKEQITGREGTKLGIEKWARRGIVGRLVLIDFERWIQKKEEANGNTPPHERYQPNAPYGITADQVRTVARDQGVSFRQGDFLLIRTGWIKWYNHLGRTEREELASREWHQYTWAGLNQGEDSLRLLWDEHFAAVAADCPSFEKWPPPSKSYSELLHGTLLGLWGMPIGELWNCEELAADCAADGKYECMLTSAPLNLCGGVASPANALALK